MRPEYIAALGVSCTNGLVIVDKKGKLLLPAILMIDQRSAPQAEWIRKNLGEDYVFSITGNRVAPGAFSAPILRWIAQERPEIYKRAHKFLVPTGFIVQRLTGQFTIDTSRAAATMLFDIKQRKWSEPLLKALSIDPAILPDLYEPADLVGGVTAEAAKATGLLQGTPVIAGCVDTVSAAIGAGAIKPGQTCGLLGTVGRVCVVTDGSSFDGRMMNFCHGMSDRWLTNAAINSTGASLKWFRNTFYQRETALAKERGVSPYDLMMQEAAQTNPGGEGLIYLPYLAGERSPIWNGDARGVLFGLSLAHQRAHIIRALMEGVAYAIRHNLEIIRDEYEVTFSEMRLSGGGANGRLWCRIVGDVTRTNVLIPEVIDTEVLGVALLAGVGAGVYSDLHQAVGKAIRIADTLPFDCRKAEIYDRYFEAYLELVKDMAPRFTHLAELSRL
jgi:xylulokinase